MVGWYAGRRDGDGQDVSDGVTTDRSVSRRLRYCSLSHATSHPSLLPLLWRLCSGRTRLRPTPRDSQFVSGMGLAV